MVGVSPICRYLEHLLKPARRNRARRGNDRHVGLQIHRRLDTIRPGGESDGADPDRGVIGGPENFLRESVRVAVAPSRLTPTATRIGAEQCGKRC